MDFALMTQRALEVRASYEEFERRKYGRPWTLEELTLGLVGDVGDLAKLIQAHEGVREIADAAAGLEHELADVLWSVIVIADRCKIDIASALLNTMDAIQESLASERADHPDTQ